MSTKCTPTWYEKVVPTGTYRSLFKWGDPAEFKHPNSGLVKLMLDTFKMSCSDFLVPEDLALDKVEIDVPVKLARKHLDKFAELCGAENLRTDTYTRIKKSYGGGMIDALRLRKHIVENIADVVVAPRNQKEIEALVAYCDEERIPMYVFGGGSTVTRGMEAVKGGVTIDMSVHMNQVVRFNETDQTITVQAGMSGPALEEVLNHAPEMLGAKRRYTCGHFPQSFEFSSVGGWVVTRGAGQNSTYYGKIEDIVLAQEYVTPHGVFKTNDIPRCATGPDFDQIMMGSEGTFGILTNVTLQLRRYMPQNRRRYSYMFKNWQDAREACREIMQAEFGYPSVFRLSDPEETDVAMKLYHIEGTIADSVLKLFGYKPMEKCLLLGHTEGERSFSANVNRKIRQIALKHGAFDISFAPVTSNWEKGRFRDPYMREDLQDFGILIDTLECAVNWSSMEEVHRSVRAFVKSRPQTVCMTHLSHAYPQGGNLYFIFIAKITHIKEYLDLQYGILEAIQKSGAAMSHHHGVGKQTSPWLEGQIGTPQMDVIRSLKEHFDPNYIMNPGGTLGLDLSPEQKEKRWSKNLEG
ncbi:MAG: FAD-binding oxidoreductase [Anaerolineaceae bacterium]|nr:FAD-binding oxidoreductase [Anaerolineaceae bacterium]